MPNRAHNDFLEWAIEAGAAGLMVLAAAVAIVLCLGWRAWRRRPADRPQTTFALCTLAIIGLHSMVDYPLRSMALACIAGLAAGILAAPPARARRVPTEREVS